MSTGGSIVWNLSADSSAFSSGLNRASSEAKDFGHKIDKGLGDASHSAAQKVKDNFNQIAVAMVGLGVGFNKLTNFMQDSVEAANRQQAAFIGLNSVAKAFGQNADEATEAAKRLSSDGLMSVGEAAKGLKNLLAAGFSLPQATKLMERFKDSASFGRQAALTFGEAVSSATEGIKNGNSILVDNAGVTKNLSVILKEAGFGADALMSATTDANVRLALFNGILKETNPQLGDAAKFADTAAGKQAMFAQKTELLKAKIGESLQPALLKLLEVLTPMIAAFSKFTTDHPQLVAAVLIIGAVLTGLLFTLGAIGLAVTGLAPIFTAMAATSSVAVGGLSTVFLGLKALILSPIAMPAIVVAAALASLAAVVIAVQAVRQAINDVNNAANAAKNLAPEQQIRDLQARATAARARGDTAEATKIGRAISALAGNALGSSNWKGGPTWVGERGPEIVNLPRGSEIIPNHKIGDQGASSEYNIGTINISSEADGERWLKKLTRNQEIFDNGLTPARNAT